MASATWLTRNNWLAMSEPSASRSFLQRSQRQLTWQSFFETLTISVCGLSRSTWRTYSIAIFTTSGWVAQSWAVVRVPSACCAK